MRPRQTFFTSLGLVFTLSSCSTPADPGYHGTIDPDSGTGPADTPHEGAGGSDSGEPAATAEGGAAGDGASSDPEEFEPDLPDYEPAVIMDDGVLHVWTLGDSITLGVQGGFRNDVYNMLTSDGYEVDLVGTLQDDSTEIDDWDHEGHTAWTLEKTLDDLDSWLAEIPRPDVVLVLLGANDFAWWTNREPEDHLVTMMKLIDRLVDRLPGAGIIVGTLIPQSPEIVESVHRDRSEMVEEFNDLLRDELPEHPEYGKHVFLADLNAVIDESELYDGIHPTREAHREVAEQWYNVITQILDE